MIKNFLILSTNSTTNFYYYDVRLGYSLKNIDRVSITQVICNTISFGIDLNITEITMFWKWIVN